MLTQETVNQPKKEFDPAFLPSIELIDDQFEIPQLKTTRRIRVLLPHDYANTRKAYPVLYLQDGQNLAGEGSAYGSWEIDRQLAVLATRKQHEIIVVMVDHANENRIREFTVDRTKAGVGKGRRYLDFITQTLKPFIDTSFRTLPDRAHTGIGGSSLGGLISVYAGLFYPDIFGRWLVFSPSLWIAPKLDELTREFTTPGPIRLYLYGGEKESKYMVTALDRLTQALRQSPGGPQIITHTAVERDGTHQEVWWGQEFPNALEWLFYESSKL